MSKHQHEINNLVTNAKLGQEILIEYLQSFRCVLEKKAESPRELKEVLKREGTAEKLRELNEVVEWAERSLEKVFRLLAT